MLTEQERQFVQDREWRNRFGQAAIIGVAAVWIGMWVWFAVRIPLLVNPFTVIRRLRADELDPGTQALLAAMCPLLFDLVGLLVVCFLVFALVWVRLEKKYLRMLRTGNHRAG